MNAFEKIIDEIDCELYGLAEKAYRLGQVMKNKDAQELARLIDSARGKSFRMLPASRQKEVRG